MQLTRPGGARMFTAHGEGYVKVNGERYDHSIVVSVGEVRTDWKPAGFDGLTEADFTYFLELKPEVLLFGTGAKQRFAHPKLYRALTDARIAVEFMDTPAACRTYNILVAEGRHVVAAILLESGESGVESRKIAPTSH
jgi:uncharacterized protein